MQLFLGEHGETIQYAVIGIMIVTLINFICINKWSNIRAEYNNKISKSNREMSNFNNKDYPVIDVDDTIYAEYKSKNFQAKSYINAKDYKGNDITENLKIYGSVDTFTKGIYTLRCVAMADNNLMSTKYVNVIVE